MGGRQPLSGADLEEEREFGNLKEVPLTERDKKIRAGIEQRQAEEKEKIKEKEERKRQSSESVDSKPENKPKTKNTRQVSNPELIPWKEKLDRGEITAQEYKSKKWQIWYKNNKEKKLAYQKNKKEKGVKSNIKEIKPALKTLQKVNAGGNPLEANMPKDTNGHEDEGDAKIELNGKSVIIDCPLNSEKLDFAINSLGYLKEKLSKT